MLPLGLGPAALFGDWTDEVVSYFLHKGDGLGRDPTVAGGRELGDPTSLRPWAGGIVAQVLLTSVTLQLGAEPRERNG